ncbi:hypothetical protein ACS0TY_025991 [Phlomoides rotata]
MFFLIMLMFSLANANNQTDHFFSIMKTSLSGPSITKWKSNNYCTYTGVSCDHQNNVVQLDIAHWYLSGKFPDHICSYLPKLRVLRMGNNFFRGGFPRGIINCTSLQELNMSCIHYTGTLPDLSPLKTLKILDLSYNLFSGDFPTSITNLTNLEILNFNMNIKFNLWQIPENISGLVNLKAMILTSCRLYGTIPQSIGSMTALTDLELSGNNLIGEVPKELGLLHNLQQLELYYNQLEGEIPDELGNLTELTDLDMSVNKFNGQIPDSICRLPKLQFLQLYNSSLSGSIPSVIAESSTLIELSLYGNFLTGEIPANLGRSSALVALDLSENNLTGKLPEGLCDHGKLKYLLVLKNMLSGKLPEKYSVCKSLIRFRVSSNNLIGEIPAGIFSLPHASIIDLSFNNFAGSIAGDFRSARNLSELFVQGNRISGPIPPEISLAINLVKIDLSYNQLSGSIPSEIGELKSLNLLLLQGNMLSSSIPDSLSSLTSLNLLDVSNNRFTGKVPENLSNLLPNSLNFSNNRLSGPIPVPFIKRGLLESFLGNPGLCVPVYVESMGPNFPICPHQKKINGMWLIAVSVVIIAVGTVLYTRRWLRRDGKVMENEDTLSSSFFSYDVKNFHRLNFDQREIIEAMVDKNIVGYGGSGTVYKMELNNGEVVAVKKLWSSQKAKDSGFDDDDRLINLDKELKNEVETLGSIRHKNIVKLYCYYSSLDCSLLVYEYMPNGNLWDALHKGKVVLDWPTRHRIALGVAQGLAYLHHDLMPPIIHRDIKSTNILLDVDFHPKVADFGIAKVLQARGGSMDSTTTVIAGTYGYLAPEYAYSSKATTRCDVYSFGVVLMELITGKKPVEAEFGENKNIIYWVSTMIDSKEDAVGVLDKRVSSSFQDEMIKVLRIAIRCTSRNAALRPTMNDVVQLLIEADPCRFHCCNLSNKTSKETPT